MSTPLVPSTYDLVVYGATAAGIAAAIQADRMGLRVALVSPDRHPGGMVSSGLGWTDSKNGNAIGGLAREFHHRVWKHYREPSAWTLEDRGSYAENVHAQPGPTIDDKKQVMWTHEPRIAEKIFENWLAETGVVLFRDEWLDREGGVEVEGRRIRSIRMLSGRVFRASMFIDAGYEGDLMAVAGVSYRLGRDRADEYGEPLNGIHFNETSGTLFEGISPYQIPGNPDSGLVAGIEGEMPEDEKEGDGDTRLQSFNIRLCLTRVDGNRVPVARPEDYNEADYELLFRVYEAGRSAGFNDKGMPNGKTDSNNEGAISLDYVGGNFSIKEGWNYSESSYTVRERINRDHLKYTQGLLWSLMNHPRIPEEYRAKWREYGLPKDEFLDNDHWPRQVYVREARRLCGTQVMNQHHVECKAGFEIADSIGLGSYSMDSHRVRRIVKNGKIWSEGGFYIYSDKTYPISYGSIVPRKEEMENLLVPVTLSATHVAFGSIRMEPTYMILGQSAATAAALALGKGSAVQDVSYEELSRRLAADGQILQCDEIEKK
jgi:hypothetical protein